MRLTLPLIFALALTPARAQVNIRIDIGLPPLPRLVLVQPGIQVVEGFQEEVFFHSGWYWCRRPHGWYRSRSHKTHFEWVEPRRVPASLTRMPQGQYKNWHRERAEERREEKQDQRDHPKPKKDHREHRDH